MSAIAETKTMVPAGVDGRVLSRVVEEGYGPGAWHGADLRAAVAEVSDDLAFWRPGPGRHNIAEIALHHAWCVRNVRAQLSGVAAEPFVLDGEDWFELSDGARLAWAAVRSTLESEQRQLAELLAAAATAGTAETTARAGKGAGGGQDDKSGKAAKRRDDAAPPVSLALGETERFDLVLGITCHAVYHAGQVQLIKVLHG